jgi:hypothetical protein
MASDRKNAIKNGTGLWEVTGEGEVERYQQANRGDAGRGACKCSYKYI